MLELINDLTRMDRDAMARFACRPLQLGPPLTSPTGPGVCPQPAKSRKG
jgi:hypothetical protein